MEFCAHVGASDVDDVDWVGFGGYSGLEQGPEQARGAKWLVVNSGV